MGPRWLAVFGCMCILISQRQSLAFPTQDQDTLVVAKNDKDAATTSSIDTTSDPTTPKAESPTTEEPLPPMKIKEMDIRSEVSLRYAHTAIVTKMRNPAKRAQEATFRVLLPETAFISSFTMIIDGKSYKAYVKEKEEAKQIYNDAVSQGLGAAHIAVKARDSNQFTVTVNIEGNETVTFNLTYEELLGRRNNVYNHAINVHPGVVVPKLTVTVHIHETQRITTLRVPEVRTGNEVDATEDDPQNSKVLIERCHDDREAVITFTPDVEEQRRLMDVYAEKSKESQAHSSSTYHYYGEPQIPKPEGVLGQFVVQYDVDRSNEGEILVNDGYFVHFFAPSSLTPLNKHVVFVLDTSGSMMERKIIQLREAMQTILGELNAGDYFSIVEFASSAKVYDLKEADEPKKPLQYGYYGWEEAPVTLVPPAPATPGNIARAKTIVSRLEANGGTNIERALNVAVDLIQKGVGWTPEPPKAPIGPQVPANNTATTQAAQNVDKSVTEPAQVVEKPAPTSDKEVVKPEDVKKEESHNLEPIIIFLTDGDPTVGETDPTRIINRLSEKNYGERKATIFALAFGEDADRRFLRKLALRNDGFMRHIYEAADAVLQLRDFYLQVSSPLLADVHFVYPKDQVKEGSLTKHKFRTFYAGSETVVAGRVADGSTELAPHVYGICGVDDGFTRKKYEIFPKVPVARRRNEYLPLERLWAYLTVKQLLDEKDAADEPTKEEKEKGNTPEKKALKIALEYEFVTPLTSLVVVKPNDTNAVNAESVDKQDSPYFAPGAAGVPLAAQSHFAALPGLPGAPSPQFAYKAALSSAIGPVHSAGFSSNLPVVADYIGPEAEEESDIAYGKTALTSHPPVYSFRSSFGSGGSSGVFGYASMPQSISFSQRPVDLSFSPDYDVSFSIAHKTGASLPLKKKSFPTTPLLRPSPSQGPVGPSVAPQAPSVAPHAPSEAPQDSSGAPQAPSVAPQVPTADSSSPLAPVHLEEYPWVSQALKPNSDVIQLEIEKDGNKTVTELELTRDDVAPRASGGDASCPVATDGATGGVCVYLTRCDAAKTISLTDYHHTYCTVNDKYAGVCCPSASVDVVKP